jgi:hypothetical protein
LLRRLDKGFGVAIIHFHSEGIIMKTKMFLKSINETISVVTISSIFGAGSSWLGEYAGLSDLYMVQSNALNGVVWSITWGTLSYYLLLRKYLTLQNLAGLMTISFLVSMMPAIIFHISTPVITSFCVILGSLYIWRTGNKKFKLEKEN